MPDPSKQFVLEVDASETGIGAVLSQRESADSHLHPCAFFSRKLSPAEKNYDVGNRELLAVHDSLKEWRHWLEGATVVLEATFFLRQYVTMGEWGPLEDAGDQQVDGECFCFWRKPRRRQRSP